jgi:uncharacterized protein (TIRG00374 family)
MNFFKPNEIKKYGSILFSIIFLVLIIWYLKKNVGILISLENLSLTDILLIIIIQPITVAINALINKLIINEMYFTISYRDVLFLQYVNALLNKLVAEGGAVYRGTYLKTVYSFPVSSFLALTGGGYIITLLVNAVVGLLFSIIIYINTSEFNIYIVLLFLITTVTTLLLIILNPRINGSNWIFERISRVLQGWNQIKRKPILILTLIFLSFLISLLQAVIIFIAFRGLGASIGFINTIFYSSLTSLVNFINITPGGLGITEGFLMFSNKVIGLPVTMVLLGALLIRTINFIVSVLFGSVSYAFLQVKLYRKLRNN